MKKAPITLLTLFLMLVIDCRAQIYYHQAPGSTAVTAGSVLLPFITITPTILTPHS